ncbi:MAG: ferredoxin--NADP reductase [Betaproteobacteria bacterium]|nr:ferredoxin--NADP reductase [Betaproteobacteria bacterium]
MPEWIEGRVIEQRQWTDRLFSLSVAARDLAYEAGQFIKLALPANGHMLARAYSFVNAPQARPYEFYYVRLPDGPLTQRLCRLGSGDAIFLSSRPAGFLVLSEVPDADNLWLLATGTGIAPFLSILRTETPWRRYGRVVLVHAVRFAQELTYREVLGGVQAERQGRLRLVSIVSRESAEGALAGRIPQAILDGRLEAAAGLALSASGSQVMICGNPAMVSDAVRALAERRMKKHRRRSPGQITVENYW